MNLKTLLPTALTLAISTCLLAACGGGGMGMGMVRPETVGPPKPLPPPAPPQIEPCPAPITGNCVVDVPSSTGDQAMTGGRQSDYALIKRGPSQLTLYSQAFTSGPPIVDYRFAGGTIVEAGTLRVASSAALQSNVVVQPAGGLGLFGAMTGNLDNHGNTVLWDKVIGNVVNDGVLRPGASIWGEVIPARIEGNFHQTPNGTLVAVIPMTANGPMTGGFLSVTGRADIDGTLRLVPYTDAWGPYPLPGAPLTMQVLHSDAGVFGQFAQWTSPGLFITGGLRYLANDVYFDITTISAVQAMAASARPVDALTLRSAGRFDAALGNAGTWDSRPDATITATQRQFLASVGKIQHIIDYDQAARTLDSLSGHGYVAAADALLQQAAMPAPELLARAGNLRSGSAVGAWSTPAAMMVSGGGTFSGMRTGLDQRLGGHDLLGASFGWTDGGLRFDRAGGVARDQSPQWDVYWRHSGNAGSYLFGDLGYGRHRLNLNRRIDLGIGSRAAGSRQSLDMLRAYLETGRDYFLGQTRLTPFTGMSYAMLHGTGFVEQGSTGFELLAQPATHERLNAVAGLRLGSAWRHDGGRWTSVNVATGYRQLLYARDDARAAFAGTPGAVFALDGMPLQHGSGWLQMNLATGGARWNSLLSYDRQASNQALSLGTTFRF